ncbi:transcriptional regulator YbiH [Klebsiella michiganensis]|nr:transcriptional regulator YbiH [Klebsiella michiganensis]
MIAPLHCYLTRLIAAYTGLNADSTEMVLHTHALLGEVLAFRLVGKRCCAARAGLNSNRTKTAQIIEVITCHIDFVLEGLSQRIWSHEKKPLIVVVLLLLLAAVIGGGWWWYQSSQQKALTLYGNVDIRTVNLSFRVGGRLASLQRRRGRCD